MTSGSRGRIVAGPMIVAVMLGGAAWAQSSPPAAPAARPAANAEAEARAHFDKAAGHFGKAEYREAYTEYLKSLELMPKRAALAGAASSLKQLGRYDEALDLYEELRRKYPNLPATMEAKIGPAIAELQGLVGTLVIAGDAPAGASLFIDDRLRGNLPLAKPLRLAVGSHTIRVIKEGFDPITGTIEVLAGKQNVAELRAQSRMGRLSVREKHSWVLAVEIDGEDVGVTPWEGLVAPGDHRVRLHGFVGLDALAECAVPEAAPDGKAQAAREGAKMASPPEMATVKLYERTQVMLGAEELDASLRIESTPSGATLAIDSRPVGRTPWEGRLLLGEHAIEVTARGFLPAQQKVRLERRKQRELQVVLEREPNVAGLLRARNIGAGVAYGVGALGLGISAVTGALALDTVHTLNANCPQKSCYATENSALNTASTLGTISTAALVVGGLGAAAGTVVLLAVRPATEVRSPASTASRFRPATVRPSFSARVGLGALHVEGRF